MTLTEAKAAVSEYFELVTADSFFTPSAQARLEYLRAAIIAWARSEPDIPEAPKKARSRKPRVKLGAASEPPQITPTTKETAISEPRTGFRGFWERLWS